MHLLILISIFILAPMVLGGEDGVKKGSTWVEMDGCVCQLKGNKANLVCEARVLLLLLGQSVTLFYPLVSKGTTIRDGPASGTELCLHTNCRWFYFN